MTGKQLKFGVDTIKDAESRRSVNPCVEMYGGKKDGGVCLGCTHLEPYKSTGTSFRCALCSLRNIRHRAYWPACAKWEGPA